MAKQPLPPDDQVRAAVTQARIRAAFAKHAKNVGLVALAWSGLHNTMAMLFATIATRQDITIGYGIWHAVPNDRAQREMLLAAAKAARREDNRMYEEIKWATGQMSALEDKRNTTLHAPYAIQVSPASLLPVTDHFTGNLRALKLKDRDLAIELASYAEHINAIHDFVYSLWIVAIDPTKPLPARPPLPRPAQSATQKALRRQTKSKSPPPRR